MMSDKVAIVTGASRAGQGAKVVASARNAGALDELVEEIKAQGGQAWAVAGDVAVEADANNLVEQAVAVYGRLDILVNNPATACCCA